MWFELNSFWPICIAGRLRPNGYVYSLLNNHYFSFFLKGGDVVQEIVFEIVDTGPILFQYCQSNFDYILTVVVELFAK